MLHKYKINQIVYTNHYEIKDLVHIIYINQYLSTGRTVNYKIKYIKNGVVKTKTLHDDWLELTHEI
jgi:hypothetical protein